MSRLAWRNRLKALEAHLTPKPVTIRISGGLPPPDLESKPPPLPGGDLHRQHKLFARPRQPDSLLSRGQNVNTVGEPAQAKNAPDPDQTPKRAKSLP